MRNVYLTHEINRQLKAKGGIITSITDPRSFIYNDHTAAVHALYESDLINGTAWYGTATKSRPAATSFEDDHYLSLQANMNFLSGIKNTIYGTYREKANVNFAQDFGGGNYNTLTGVAKTYWLGGTFEYAGLDPLIAEFTYIGNWNKFRSNTGIENTMFAYLTDLKLGLNFSSLQLNMTVEGLATSGAKGAVDTSGNKILGKRGAFSSPVAAAYLMTIATNDGLDDAAGTPKQSTIANLGQDEGVRILVGTLSRSFGRDLTATVRWGELWSAAASSVTNSNRMGMEVDLVLLYQLSSAATLGAEYGRFRPGAFFTKRDQADLFSLKYKFSF